MSQRIKKLEAQAGTRLVERSPVVLTAAGASLLPMARRTVASAGATTAHLSALRAGRSGALHVGVLSHGGGEVMAATLRSFSEQFPEIAVTLRALDFPEAASAVKERDVDVASVRPRLGDDRLHEYPVFTENGYAIPSRWDERARLRELSVADIDRAPFLTPADGFPVAYRSFLHLLREHNDEPPRIVDSHRGVPRRGGVRAAASPRLFGRSHVTAVGRTSRTCLFATPRRPRRHRWWMPRTVVPRSAPLSNDYALCGRRRARRCLPELLALRGLIAERCAHRCRPTPRAHAQACRRPR